MRHGKMRVECGAAGPVFVEHEDARIGRIDVEVVVDAVGFGPGGHDLCGKEVCKLFAVFGAGGDGADDRVHVRSTSG
jgi:hypothetical protein